MKLVIFGANGPTGRLLTRQALDRGFQVRALTRNVQTFPLKNVNLEVRYCDVFDPAEVEQSVAGGTAVISTLGVPYSKQRITVYSAGTQHIINSMHEQGLERLICVSSELTHYQTHPEMGFFNNHVVAPFLRNYLGKTLYDDMGRMELAVSVSGLNWTIMRPAALFDTDKMSLYQTAEQWIAGNFTSRVDLAACMLNQLGTDAFSHKVLAVATDEDVPSTWDVIRKEAFKKSQ
ncbi:NAD-dependent epimerase/dehydratase family protein [Deinococcus psychrotolerans]|uniref:NAD-dependent epimerase/dehydratase family protein n=1 Tax=Deinococcus psychrotolerans TaxID=2489213 RepID=A0A3G8YGW7_9DEIO|nr:NAD(P)H-binding protein [Deinococcus psychrotolerans]AZI44213.1 NAD-dependent epimerase/dehydratase family protein [Deinococcus psychrotolerans]